MKKYKRCDRLSFATSRWTGSSLRARHQNMNIQLAMKWIWHCCLCHSCVCCTIFHLESHHRVSSCCIPIELWVGLLDSLPTRLHFTLVLLRILSAPAKQLLPNVVCRLLRSGTCVLGWGVHSQGTFDDPVELPALKWSSERWSSTWVKNRKIDNLQNYERVC